MPRTFMTCFALSSLVAALTPSVSAAQTTTLLKTDSSWEGTPYTAYPAGAPELSLLKITIPANTALDWHQHPMPNAAYILSGELTIETRDLAHRKVFRAGDVVAETVGRQHRGITGAAPVELLVFYAGSPGMPLSE